MAHFRTMPIRHSEPDEHEDLSPVIKRMRAVRQSTRIRQANDQKTRAVIAAAARLLDAQFAPPDGGHDDDQRRFPFFNWLSRTKIAEEVVAAEPAAHNADLSQGERERAWVRLLEDRWVPHDRFIQDFLHYAINARHWSLHISLSEEARDTLLRGLREGDFPAAVHEVAFEDLVIPIETPSTQRIQLLATVLADREPEFGDVVKELYASVDSSWTALYEALFAERGWTLRPGLTFQHLNLMLSTAAEGMALRGLVDPTSVIDPAARKSLLGTLALALMLSCVDPGDGLSIEEVAEVFTPPLPDQGATS